MDSAVILVLFALLTAFVNNAAASCKEVTNYDMLEYLCEGGHPTDLSTLPLATEKLRISKMPIRRITANTFSKFNRNLLVLSCLHCEITDIDADAFRDLINLQQLNLDSNYLTTVKASWFKDLNFLTYLDLSYNHIRDIEDDVYKNLPSLVDFRISGNRLRCLNLTEMSHLNELKRIFLSENSDFACPHAVSKFLDDRGVVFEQDPEWRKLASDTIHVYVPPNYAKEEDYKTTPAYHERPQSNKKPSSEERTHDVSLMKNRMFHPEHGMKYNGKVMQPTYQNNMPLPRVEPRFPSDLRTSITPPTESSPHQVTHYPYSTLKVPQAPPVMESSSEDIKKNGQWTETDKSSETDTLSPYTLRTTIAYPTTYLTTQDTQIIESESFSENEIVTDSDGSLQIENTTPYSPHVTTSYDQEKKLYKSNEMTYSSFNDFDMSTPKWLMDRSTNIPNESPSWIQNKNESPRLIIETDTKPLPLFTNTRDQTSTPHASIYDQYEMLDKNSNADDLAIDQNLPQTAVFNDVYIRPSYPEIMYPTDQLYQPYFGEGKATMHSPQSHQEHNDVTTFPGRISPDENNKPLPKCSNSSALNIQPGAVLVISIIVTVFGHVIAEGF